MLPLTNVVADRSRPTTYTANDAVLTGGSNEEYALAWCASARTTNTGINPGTPDDEATRTKSTCYIRGLKESIEIQVNNGLPWQWRRILFTVKGRAEFWNVGSNIYMANLTSNGYRRTVNEIFGSTKADMYSILFKGTQGTDWNDPLTALVDTSRATILYDRTHSLASGNDRGFIRNYQKWHPVNKNIVYDDDQIGGDNEADLFSTLGKPGCGDIMVLDLFRPRGGSVISDQLSLRPQATLYWHER